MEKIDELIFKILKQDQNKIRVKNKKTGNTYQVSKPYYDSHRSNYDIVKPKSNKSKKERQKVSIANGFKVPPVQKQHIDNMLAKCKKWLDTSNKSDSDKQRFSVFSKNLKMLVSETSSKQEKLKSLTNLVQLGLIETNDHNPEKEKLKIYFSDNLASIFDDKNTSGLLRCKSITSSGKPNQMTRDICLFAMENGIEIPIRSGGGSKVQGQFNERGTVAILDPSDEHKTRAKEQFDLLVQRVGKAKAEKIEKCNQAAANKILEILGDNKLIRVEQVGNLGKRALSKMGIDDKKDPTDIIVYYQDKDGNEQSMKISMKIYKNINAITLKGAGITNAASYYLGNQAKALDDELPKLISKNNFKEKDITQNERLKRFKNFQEDYIMRYKQYMQKLVGSDQGQQRLLKMWRQVHGCGTNTWTCVTNVGKETVDLRSPDYYCNPKLPFVVIYNGTKISVQLSQKGQKFLDIMVARSTDWGTPYLKFVARRRTIKSSKEPKVKKSKNKNINIQNKVHTKIIKEILQVLQQPCRDK